jgi:hypothetical protein
MRFTIVFFLSGLMLSSAWWGCKKQDANDIHIDTVISNNNPPPYNGVSDVQITTYINKLYIDLLGRAPSQEEIESGLNYLQLYDLKEEARDTLIQQLIETPAYYKRLFDLNSADFINGADSADISYEIQLISFLYYLDSLNGNEENFIYYQYELNRLADLQNVTTGFMNGEVTLNDYFAAFLNNYLYDQVNMGSENFVKGSFSNLFRRSPTTSELASGVGMVDNVPSILLLQSGTSKGDFIRIVTNCDEFYEGLVLKTYEQLLLRDPSSEEMSNGTAQLEQSNDFPEFEKTIMKSIEYAGF